MHPIPQLPAFYDRPAGAGPVEIAFAVKRDFHVDPKCRVVLPDLWENVRSERSVISPAGAPSVWYLRPETSGVGHVLDGPVTIGKSYLKQGPGFLPFTDRKMLPEHAEVVSRPPGTPEAEAGAYVRHLGGAKGATSILRGGDPGQKLKVGGKFVRMQPEDVLEAGSERIRVDRAWPRTLLLRRTDTGERWLLDSRIRVGRVAYNYELNEMEIRRPNVSKSHMQFISTPEGPKVMDRGSTSGTFVNDAWLQQSRTGFRPAPRLLRAGDRIRIGDTGPEFEVQGLE